MSLTFVTKDVFRYKRTDEQQKLLLSIERFLKKNIIPGIFFEQNILVEEKVNNEVRYEKEVL
jgi:hypothetical protein